ncbi:TRAP transporter small permease [Metabacillus litoralis]|uniref:TRAP transporter small permease n=1 Tax=Metabacillus litoralis TaxID=152268 RepID=UPI002041F3DC|nr:TRAP transporter small permease [Metabacillus litoralis]MCM3411859.1 TRAP transporter small permease [Metabacillus litoralis]
MNIVKRISDAVFTIEKYLVIVLMTIMLVSLVAGVTYRYFLNSPLSWPEELAIIMLVWVTFVGGSMSIKRQQAAAVSILLDRLQPKLRKILLIIGFSLIIAFCGYLIYLCINWVSAPSVFMQKLPSLGVAMFYPYLAIPIGFIGMGIHSICLLIEVVVSGDTAEL